jgi:hypothetical protein
MNFTMLLLKSNVATKLEPFWVMKLEKGFSKRGKGGYDNLFFHFIINNGKLRHTTGFYHDNVIDVFMSMIITWMKSFEQACNNEFVMTIDGAFIPDLSSYDIIKERIIKHKKWDRDIINMTFKME